ncbi:rubrerythrin [candidate division KSB1 bacterium]|nr:MAG: rubrerythrin [candidate division KSB1 bacterium]
MHFSGFEDVIRFAIEKEEEAMNFYKELSKTARNPAMESVFLEWSSVEKKHKELLENLKISDTGGAKIENITDLKIGDYLVDVEQRPDMSYQDALILAIKREEKSFKLYSDLEARCKEKTLCDTFNHLKQEEAKHKLKLETEYDEFVLKEN